MEAQPSRARSSSVVVAAYFHSRLQEEVDLNSSLPVVDPDSSRLQEDHSTHIAKEVEDSCASVLGDHSSTNSTTEAITALVDIITKAKPFHN